MLERELASLERRYREGPTDLGTRVELARVVARTGRLPAGLEGSDAVITLVRLLEAAPEARGLADILLARLGWSAVAGRELSPGPWWSRSGRLGWGDDHWYDGRTGMPLQVRVEGEGLVLCWIPPGTVASRGDAWSAIREISLLRGFYLARLPISRASLARRLSARRAPARDAELPAGDVEFVEAVTYCRNLTDALGPKACPRFRYALPSADEWEYACRAGTTATTYASPLSTIAWYRGGAGQARPSGEKLPNGFGLHDTLGCVWEWTRSTEQDPQALHPVDRWGQEGPSQRAVARGGSALSSPSQVRAGATSMPGREVGTRRLVGLRVAALLDDPEMV